MALVELVIAVDVGKRADRTALCIVERVRPRPPETDTSKWHVDWKVPSRETLYLVRDLGRLPIGTKHTDGAFEIAKVCHDARCYDPDGSLTFLLDATGIGEGLADLLERYLPSDVRMTKCWFTGSERVERVKGELRVGKSFVVSRLTSLLETGRVRLGDVPQRHALVEELRDFEFRVTQGGNYTAEARSGAHDDLITALALATLLEGSAVPSYRPLPPSPYRSQVEDDWHALHAAPPALW